MEFRVFEMQYTSDVNCDIELACVPFKKEYFEEYRRIYNECFYEMRKSLARKPYDFLGNFEQIMDKADDIYVLFEEGEIIGSVSCYGNEVDDLIVNQRFQKQGYGKKLLLWAMKKIREHSDEPISLHVAEWNQNAVSLYKKIGFEIINIIEIRGEK